MKYPHLEEQTWVTPKSYAGYDPVGHYIIATRHRDSGLLESTNWDAIIREMGQPASLHDNGSIDESLYTWSVSHWGVGWVEYLTLKPNAPADMLDQAETILARLADYPIVDDELMAEREIDAMYAYWDNCDLRERVTLLSDSGDNIFAARHGARDRADISTIPESTMQRIRDRLSW